MKKIVVIQGPNINLTGEREKGVYGKESYVEICAEIESYAKEQSFECEIFQSNYEGAIIDRLHAARFDTAGVIINAGAYTHYSYAIRDAISAIKIPCVEVHMSNIHNREEFRNKSVIAPVCVGQIIGFGKISYLLAVDCLKKIL